MEPVKITFSDGIERVLQYSLASTKRLKTTFNGASIMKGGLSDIDEDKLSALLLEGLRDKSGKLPNDLDTVEKLDEIVDMRQIKYYMECFAAAYAGSNTPAKNDESSQSAPGPQLVTSATPIQ